MRPTSPRNGTIESTQGHGRVDDAVARGVVAREVDELDAEHLQHRARVRLVRPFWMTEYMMNSSGNWSSSGRQPAGGVDAALACMSSCWAMRTFIESPL